MAKPSKQRTEKIRQDRHALERGMGETAASCGDVTAVGSADSVAVNRFFRGFRVRILCSLLLIGYLLVVWLGPLSNPVGSEFLTRPLARWVAPLHRSLFLGHGYRFFGPDPGPSHILVYRIVDEEGELVEHRFPDRDKIRPRLLYHRWFMLSETLYQELNFTVDQQSFEETQAELNRQIEALQFNRQHRLARRIQRERDRIETEYSNARSRIEKLVAAIGRNLMERHQGVAIEMFLQERTIPFPAAVLTGQKLNDPVYLSDLRKIAEFQTDAEGVIRSVDDLWQDRGAPPTGEGSGSEPRPTRSLEIQPSLPPSGKILPGNGGQR